MITKKHNVLCFVPENKGRDVEIVIPLAFFCERYLNCDVEFVFIWDIYAIRRKQPDLVLLPNARGHNLLYEISKYAYQNKIPVFAQDSEGDWRVHAKTYDHWSYNTDKFFYQRWVCAWSDRTMEYLKNLAPKQTEKLVRVGAVQFDRYKIFQFQNKKDFFKKHGLKEYDKIIGYAGWGFGKMYGKHKDIAFRHIFPGDQEKRFAWLEKQRSLVRDVLRSTIEAHPDKLFIFKRHPKESFESDHSEGPNEMNELLDYDNVIYLKNEEKIHDLVAISDIWLGFETSTALESWMLNKATILINPDQNFDRNELYQGSLIVKTYKELAPYLKEFFKSGEINDFNSLENKRKELVSRSIGYDDGMNHIRTGIFIKKTIDEIKNLRIPTRKARLNLRHLRLFLLMHLGKPFFNRNIFLRLPKFQKTVYVFETMDLPLISETRKEYYRYLEEFHQKHHIPELFNKGELEKRLFE